MKPSQTAKDFKKEYKEIQKSVISINAHINVRLKEMATANPNAVVLTTGKIKHTAGAYLGRLSLNGLNLLDIESKLNYLEAIERHVETKEKYIQGKLFN